MISTFLALSVGYLRDRAKLRQDQVRLVGFATGVVGWSLLFSPILWYHYWYYVPVRSAVVTFPISGESDRGRSLPQSPFSSCLAPGSKIPPFSTSFYAARLVPGWICLISVDALYSRSMVVDSAGPPDPHQ